MAFLAVKILDFGGFDRKARCDLSSKEKAFATDEHGITRKRRIKAFSPRRRKERKVKQEIQAYLLLLSVLSVFAVKILSFNGFAK